MHRGGLLPEMVELAGEACNCSMLPDLVPPTAALRYSFPGCVEHCDALSASALEGTKGLGRVAANHLCAYSSCVCNILLLSHSSEKRDEKGRDGGGEREPNL